MLHIVGRRADGYHLLQSVFQFLDHADVLTYTRRQDGQLRRVNPLAGVAAENDLVMRAARLLAAQVDAVPGVDIHLDKQLPMGGGLGGGSSDAATTLLGLNHLWQLGLDIETLAQLGLTLGADVPVFVHGHAAWAEGVGEQLLSVDLPEPWFLVINPGCHVATAEIFSAPELTRDSPLTTIADFLAGRGRNDCEPVVSQRYPPIRQALQWLGQFAPARLTGTGACIFAAFATQLQAQQVLDKLPGDFQGFIARGLNRSPVLQQLTD